MSEETHGTAPARIAMIMGKLWAGGVETVIFNYYRQLDRSKIQFDFYYDSDSTIEPPADLIAMGARFYEIPQYQMIREYHRALRKYFHENRYIIVHSNINSLSVFPLYAAWREHIPVRIAHNHSVPGGHEIKRNLIKGFLRHFARVFATDYFACSEKAGRWLFTDRVFDRGEVKIIRNGVDFDRFREDTRETELLTEEYGLRGRFVVGHVGRFTYAKNHGLLLDIFAEIVRRRKDAVLMLVGDGEMYDKIISKIAELGLQEHVILTGKTQHAERFYPLFDVLLVTSYYEGLSLATVEAQVSGVPVVASEAVSDEAVISDAVVKLGLSDGIEDWASAVLETAGRHVTLDVRSRDYDIRVCAPILGSWYTRNLNRFG